MSKLHKAKKQKKRQEKIKAAKQYRLEHMKRFQLQVLQDGKWVRPRDIHKKTDTPEFFHNRATVDDYLKFLADLKTQNGEVLEGRIIEVETGKQVAHIAPYAPLSEEEWQASQQQGEWRTGGVFATSQSVPLGNPLKEIPENLLDMNTVVR